MMVMLMVVMVVETLPVPSAASGRRRSVRRTSPAGTSWPTKDNTVKIE